MKNKMLFVLVSTLLLTFSAYGAGSEKADCKTGDYPLLAWISTPKIVEEDADFVEAKFYLQFGSCKSGTNLVEPIDRRAKVELWDSKAYKFWKKKQPFTYEVTIVRSCKILVEVTYNKSVIFKKKSHRETLVQFYPLGTDYQLYEWTLDVDKLSEVESTVKLAD